MGQSGVGSNVRNRGPGTQIGPDLGNVGFDGAGFGGSTAVGGISGSPTPLINPDGIPGAPNGGPLIQGLPPTPLINPNGIPTAPNSGPLIQGLPSASGFQAFDPQNFNPREFAQNFQLGDFMSFLRGRGNRRKRQQSGNNKG